MRETPQGRVTAARDCIGRRPTVSSVSGRLSFQAWGGPANCGPASR